MKKRILAILLTSVMALSMVACAAKETPSEDATADAAVEESEVKEEVSSIPALTTYADTYNSALEELKGDLFHYGYEDPITLKIGKTFASTYTWREGEDVENNTWLSLYKELGYEQDLIFSIADEQKDTKFATAISSGEYPDVFESISVTQMHEYAKSGVLADITDAFEEYATDELKEYVNWNGLDNSAACMVDGKLYGIPMKNDRRTDAMMMFVRQDWLDNLGLEMPTTMEELKAVAKAFTENDPDGDGIDDTYGLGLCGKDGFWFWSGVQAFFEGYGAAPGHWGGGFQFMEEDGKLIWGGEKTDAMKAALTDLQEMYNNGWLAKSFTTMDSAQIQSDIAGEICGIYFAPQWGAESMQVELLKVNPDAELAAATIPDGMGEGSAIAYIPSVPNQCVAVSSKCENPEALVKIMNIAVRLIDNAQSDEEIALFNGGGTSVIDVYKQQFVAISRKTVAEDTIGNFDAVQAGEVTEASPERARAGASALEYVEKAKTDGTLADAIKAEDAEALTAIVDYGMFKANGSYAVIKEQVENDILYSDAYMTVATDAMNSSFATLNKMALETIIKIICGDSVDTYDTFLESWYELGGNDVLSDANAWYSAK